MNSFEDWLKDWFKYSNWKLQLSPAKTIDSLQCGGLTMRLKNC